MRLHTALEYMTEGRFRSLEPWKDGDAASVASYIQHHAGQIAEFSFSFVDPDTADDTLQIFINFSNALWDEQIAPIPHDFFWLSWNQKILQETVHFVAFCERVFSEIDGRMTALSVRVMFENKLRNGMGFVNQTGFKIIGDHKSLLVSGADQPTAELMTNNGFGVVAALLGALATPQAVRVEEPAPVKLNKNRLVKGRPTIAPRIVIDVRASALARSGSATGGGGTVRPHWRRGHLRHLGDGRVIPVSPSWVNAEGDIPPPKQYLVKM